MHCEEEAVSLALLRLQVLHREGEEQVEGQGREVDVDGRRLSLTNLDKVLYSEVGFTKGEVIDYYARIAPVMLPHLRGRPVTLIRFPNGVTGKHFYEKNSPSHRPDWVGTATVWAGDRAGNIDFTLVEERATLVWLAQLAALELHPSLSLAADMDRPTVLAFDLDPGPPATIVECCRVALLLRELFGSFGLDCLPKSSGSKGMQVYVPLNSGVTYETTKPYARTVAQALEAAEPGLVVSRMTKDLRAGKVLVDWSQNTASKTTVAAYSLRAREAPTVSTPLRWEEVEAASEAEDPDLLRFDSAAVLARVDELGDLFAPVLELEQELPAAPG
ncbi:MAG: non-homologous end-joining DNA ligase [Solirubrobacterales bacterium]